jgi:hypothetical protein
MDGNKVVEARSTNTAISVKKTRKKRKLDVTGDAQTIGEAPSQKKRKCKAKVGRLEGLMSVPMDVLFEVFYCSSWICVTSSYHSPPDIQPFVPNRYSAFGAYHERISTCPPA